MGTIWAQVDFRVIFEIVFDSRQAPIYNTPT